jgi:hypothetical protein
MLRLLVLRLPTLPMIQQSLIDEARRLAAIEIIPGNIYSQDVMEKIELARALVEILDAIYVQDCHISGMHDPTHTPHYVCEDQLRDLAIRVLGVTHGVTDWHDMPKEATKEQKYLEVNKIPRRLIRKDGDRWSWYQNYVENHPEEAKVYENWEKNGCIPRQER